MSVTAESIQARCHDNVVRLATPAKPGEKMTRIIDRVARKTGLTAGQVKRLYYAEWANVPATVFLILEQKVSDHERRLAAQSQTRAARRRALGLAVDPHCQAGADRAAEQA